MVKKDRTKHRCGKISGATIKRKSKTSKGRAELKKCRIRPIKK